MTDGSSDWSQAWAALWFSVKVSGLATVVATGVAVPLAYARTRRRPGGIKSLLWSAAEAVIMLTLVLPPTVVGFLLVVVFGARGWVGGGLMRAFGYSLLFRWEAAVLAAGVVALPLVYMPAKAGFAAIDRDLEDSATLCGATGARAFFSIAVPLAWRGIASGIVLGLARALGEFGATLMVLGLQPDKTTLPLVVWEHFESGELSRAVPAVLLLAAAAMGLVVLFERWGGGRRS